MRLGIDASRATTGQRTGTEAYAFYLLQALVPLAVSRGHQVRLYLNETPGAGDAVSKSFAGQPGVELAYLPFPRLWTHLRLGAELAQRPPDLFFTPAHVIPLSYRGPSAATVHDLGYHFFPEAHTRRQVAYLRWSTRHNARRARVILADSSATQQDLAGLYDISTAKIEVVYPGLTPGLAPVTEPAQLRAVQQRYGLRQPYFLFLSTLQPRKNVARLIRAYIAADVPQTLVLAGKVGWRAGAIMAALDALPPQQRARIQLIGYVPETDKAALLSGAAALLYPSLYEGFGIPVLEAQACGTPVLTSNSSCLPEVAGAGALLVDPEDEADLRAGIRRLAADGELWSALVQAGRENVGRFTWEQAAAQALAAFEQVAR